MEGDEAPIYFLRCFSSDSSFAVPIIPAFLNHVRMIVVVTEAHALLFHPLTSNKVVRILPIAAMKLCSPSMIHCSHMSRLKSPVHSDVKWLEYFGLASREGSRYGVGDFILF